MSGWWRSLYEHSSYYYNREVTQCFTLHGFQLFPPPRVKSDQQRCTLRILLAHLTIYPVKLSRKWFVLQSLFFTVMSSGPASFPGVFPCKFKNSWERGWSRMLQEARYKPPIPHLFGKFISASQLWGYHLSSSQAVNASVFSHFTTIVCRTGVIFISFIFFFCVFQASGEREFVVRDSRLPPPAWKTQKINK